ncbi:helix-turn-helix domain-containing protein [Micromonospora echinaurantiaca]|uniref:helix-turn-helix domain-containing protein n=1 Tax=Micromonospora echinaurantiaca TaxID=47857 RepID=UPI001E44CC3A|nr:helix-turn-helix transcriptional regulator [Micromonospora echinaurantiaca]
MPTEETVGQLLRRWRLSRTLSQLDLAIQADVSARHISFVETGRTIPSSAMVLRLAEHLNVPLRERNRLLVAAGHAPVYRERTPGDPDFDRVREALGRILRAHEPYPAIALDRRWNVLIANAAFDILLEGVDSELLQPPINMMRLGFHPRGLAPRIRNLAQVRAHLLPRLGRQAAHTGDPHLIALHEELLAYGQDEQPPGPDPADIALPIQLDHHGTELCMINTVTTFGAAFDLALEEVTIETYLPANETTARHYRHLGRLRADNDTDSACPRTPGS